VLVTSGSGLHDRQYWSKLELPPQPLPACPDPLAYSPPPSAACIVAAGPLVVLLSDAFPMSRVLYCRDPLKHASSPCLLILKKTTHFCSSWCLLPLCRAFGGVAGWDGEGSPVAETDESINYQIVDRPTQGHKWVIEAQNG
jgi:hypothetical protein